MARVKYGSTTFDLAIKGTQAEVTKLIVATARREHEAIMKADPRPGGFRRIVDGSIGAPLEQVKRVVVFEYQRLEEVVQFALATLIERSPVKSGQYRRSHVLFHNGVAVKSLKDWKPGDSVVIANSMPYSRKIEIGKMKMRLPGSDHVYFQAERIVNARYGNLAKAKFTYQGVIGGGIQAYADIALGGRKGGKTASAGKRAAYVKHNAGRYPALTITER